MLIKLLDYREIIESKTRRTNVVCVLNANRKSSSTHYIEIYQDTLKRFKKLSLEYFSNIFRRCGGHLFIILNMRI